jgi:hypothetical protein
MKRILPVVDEKQTSIHRIPNPSLLAAQDALITAAIPNPTPENPLIISASELRDWRRCRVKHHWRHQCRLEKVGGAVALDTGTLVHNIIEEWYRIPWTERTVKFMTRIAKKATRDTKLRALASDDLELIEAMTIGYAAWAKQDDRRIGLRDCFPEEWFMLPLNPEKTVYIRGRLDNRFEPRSLRRTLACQETKTAGQFRDQRTDTMLQLSMYLFAMMRKYPNYKRYIAYFTRLRKQLPGPRVKADLFDREPVEREPEEIKQWAIDTARNALDMLGAAVYPNPTPDCGWDCDFQIPCLLRGNDEDLKHVLTSQYQTKERRP